jgi:NosR/NirI family nitrous oxide reductase transcriptional regulator
MTRFIIVLLLIPAILLPFAARQAPADARLQNQLKTVFAAAASFSTKQTTPLPHFVAYAADGKTVLGYAFWTTELEPLERGYDGPIKILVGMDTKGILTGVLVVENHEPYGYFSVEPPKFAAQFKGKNVRDPFNVGVNVDAVTGATISIKSATRAIRNSSLRIGRALLTPEASK